MKDNFSNQAALYAKFRPKYPTELYTYLYKRCQGFLTAWDCGTGNGQVAQELAKKFQVVNATDISQSQLNQAVNRKNINYQLTSAEDSQLESNSINLITVAQAIHWFDFDKFYTELTRVATSGCLLAYWAYALPTINPKIDEALIHFHDHIIGPYWDNERSFWHQEYKNIQYPLRQFERKDFNYTTQWQYQNLEGYLNSWSAVQHYIRREGHNPVTQFFEPFKSQFTEPKQVVFPIFLYAGLV